MDRRIVLSGLLLGAIGARGSGAQAQGAPPAAPAAIVGLQLSDLSDAVKTHIRDTLAVGLLSLVLSRLSQAKLKHPMTRQFADFEVAEQDGLADVLRSSTTPGAPPKGVVVPTTDAEAESSLDGDGRAALARFRDMAAGPEFEKAYVQAQVEGHKRLLAVQEAYLKVADDAAETVIAKLVRGRVQEHLVILGDIGRHLG